MLLKILIILEVILIFIRIKFARLHNPDHILLLLEYPGIIFWHNIFKILSDINGFIIIVMIIFNL